MYARSAGQDTATVVVGRLGGSFLSCMRARAFFRRGSGRDSCFFVCLHLREWIIDLCCSRSLCLSFERERGRDFSCALCVRLSVLCASPSLLPGTRARLYVCNARALFAEWERAERKLDCFRSEESTLVDASPTPIYTCIRVCMLSWEGKNPGAKRREGHSHEASDVTYTYAREERCISAMRDMNQLAPLFSVRDCRGVADLGLRGKPVKAFFG